MNKKPMLNTNNNNNFKKNNGIKRSAKLQTITISYATYWQPHIQTKQASEPNKGKNY